MKKTYMKPTVEVVKIESIEMMLEGSREFIEDLGAKECAGETALGKDRGIEFGFGDLW